MQLDPEEIEDFITRALSEDIGRGDLTSNVTIAQDAVFNAALVARQDMVVCGIDIAMQTFDMLVPDFVGEPKVADGEPAAKGTILATVAGNARAILAAERTALNILAHLSGISTEVRKYVDAVEGTGATMAALNTASCAIVTLDVRSPRPISSASARVMKSSISSGSSCIFAPSAVGP